MRDDAATFEIRAARAADIPAMVAADRAASALFRPTGLLSEAALAEHVPAEVFEAAIAAGLVFAASHAQTGHVAGFALAQPTPPDLYLDQVSVDPDFGRRGLGRALVERVIEEARARRLAGVTLSTFRDVPFNGPFYRSMGFRELPRRKLTPFLREIEDAQKPSMDITLRCFMRRPIRRFTLLRAG